MGLLLVLRTNSILPGNYELRGVSLTPVRRSTKWWHLPVHARSAVGGHRDDDVSGQIRRTM